jgi:hypothetical protein
MGQSIKVFISYSQYDGDAAASLLELLEGVGVTCFLAEKSIDPGIEWDSAIREAIRQTDHLLVLVTPKSKDSVWVAAEVGAAWVLGKTVIPALQSVEVKDLIGPLCKYQARKAETARELELLIRHISGQRADKQRTNESLLTKLPVNFPDFTSPIESFSNPNTWNRLLKVGDWLFDTTNGAITGKGIYRYILSQHTYGPSPFTIECRLTFLELHPENSIDAVNAGIVLGWCVPSVARRYYHIAFSGTNVFLELIGNKEGNEYWDYEHLSQEVPFPLVVNQPYEFIVKVSSSDIQLLCSNKEVMRVKIPINSIKGRVGLRPWRSMMKCNHFKVEEVKS